MTGRRPGAPDPWDPRLVAGHVAMALRVHLDENRRQRGPVPAGVEELEQLFQAWATGTRSATVVAGGPAVPRLLVNLHEAAQALDVSESTVKRMVSTGELPSVLVQSARKVRVADLDAFVDGLAGSGRVHTHQLGSSRDTAPAGPHDADDSPTGTEAAA